MRRVSVSRGSRKSQRLGDRNLIDQDLALVQRCLRDTVACLDDGRLAGAGGGAHAGGLGEELADRDRVGGVVGALIDHLEDIVRAEDRSGDLHSSGTPPVGHGHFAARERHLIARNGDRLQNGAPYHSLGLLIQIGEVVSGAHSAASAIPGRLSLAAFANSARRRRTSPSSAWKVDVVGQLQVLDEAGRLDIVRMHEDDSSSCAGALTSSPSSRARSARSTSAMAIALRSPCPKVRP